MAGRLSRKHGLPFKGYLCTIPTHLAPPDYAVDPSYNFLYRPTDGSFELRKGSFTAAGTYNNGFLGGVWGDVVGLAKPRCLGELQSPSIDSATYSCLYTKEALDHSSYRDDGKFGQLGFYDTEVCGKSASSEYGAGGAAEHFVCVPLWYDSGEGGLTRMVTEFSSRFHCPGSRRFLDVGDWRHFPSYHGTPSKWNRRFNTAALNDNKEMHYPSGPVPPLWCPTFTWGTPATGVSNWRAGQTFYGSVMFQNEDGSWSMPAVPRPIGTILTGGFGLSGACPGVYNETPALCQYVPSITWAVPIGPPGTVRRALLRSDSWNANDTVVVTAAYDKLKVVAIVDDNTSISYVDTKGNDSALLDDPDHLYVRWDHIMPPPARYAWEFDGRVAHGYGRTSRCAIFLAPLGRLTTQDLNLPLDASAATWGTGKFFAYNDGSNLTLRYDSGTTTASTPIPLSLGGSGPLGVKTLQDLVDSINVTTTGSSCREWRAQVAPGASPQALASWLLCHNLTISCLGDSGGTALGSASLFGPVAVGMAVQATGISAGTYVRSIQTNSLIHLCDANGDPKALTGAVSGSVTFYFNLGDGSPTGTSFVGNQRIVGGSYYGCLYFKNTYFAQAATEPLGKSSVWMTIGGPMQVRHSANAFVSSPANKHTPTGKPGICMGGGGLADGSVVFYAAERHVLRNTRGGRSGLDEDYRLDRMSLTGCIADGGIAVGYGWVGFPSWEGYMLCDINNEINVTRALWDGSSRVGEFGEEFAACISSSANDTDDGTFYAAVVGNKLHLVYRKPASGDTEISRRVVMDFGEGAKSSGLGQVMAPDGSPWGWSTPLYAANDSMGAIGSVRSLSGFSLYATRTPLSGHDGRIEQIDCGGGDILVAVYFASICCARDSCNSMRHKSVNDTSVKYLTAPFDDVWLSMICNPGAVREDFALPGNTDSQGYSIATIQWGQPLRAKARSFELRFEIKTSGPTTIIFWGAETSVDVLDTYD